MGGFSARVADQKNTIMLAAWMAVSQIGIGAFHPHCEIIRYEQVKNPVHAIRCNAFAAGGGHQFGDVICRSRAREAGQCFKDRGPRIGPLFTGFFEIRAGCIRQRIAMMLKMIVFSHPDNLGTFDQKGNGALING